MVTQFGENNLTLLEIVRDLAQLDGDKTIYAAEPFTEESDAILGPEPELQSLPKDAEERGLKYFLEVFIAREVLEDWVPEEAPTLQDKCGRLIKYAITDA